MERLGLVPSHVREYVIDRDASACRVCGRYVEYPALHHIRYRSQGGLDVPSNLITIGWLPGHDCHSLVHGTAASLWRTTLLDLTGRSDWVTGIQIVRQTYGSDGLRDRVGRRVV